MLPTTIDKELDHINRCFFWNKDQSFSPLIGWDKVCKHKRLGGVGIHKTKDMNQALQMKFLWKILAEPYNPWVQVIKTKYLKETPFLNTSEKVTHPGNGPNYWN